MSLTKVVVVVYAKTKMVQPSQSISVSGIGPSVVMETSHKEIEFVGENLKLIDAHSATGTADVLVVKDGDKELAVFKDWLYWKKLE